MTAGTSPADPAKRLLEAEARAAAARGRLSHTVSILQGRLQPRQLAQEIRRELRGKGGVAAHRTAEGARRNPGALAGLVALAGLFLARHRIGHLFRKPGRATPAAPASLSDSTTRTET